MTFTDLEIVFGQLQISIDGYDPFEYVDNMDLETKFCPPGYIIDDNGYCDPETKSVVPIAESENTMNKTETWPAGNNAFFTNKQLMSMGKLMYLVYENELLDFKIEYPEGSGPHEYGGGLINFYLGGNTEVSVSVYDRSEPNNSLELVNYMDESIRSLESSSNFPDFKLISSQVNTKFLAGYPSYSLAGTYNQGAGLINETGAIINDMIYSIQYSDNDNPDLLPIIEHMIGSFDILNKFS